MGTVTVQVVCVGRGRSMPSFYLFLYIYAFFCRDTGFFSPCGRHLTLYLKGMESGLSPFLWLLFCSDTSLFPPCRRHVLSICREWHLPFLLCYHVQCLTHTSLTPVFGGQSITNAPLITPSTQVPHVPLKNLSRQAA